MLIEIFFRLTIGIFWLNQMYTELTGHSFKLNASFNEVVVDNYDALIIPGGRFVEPLSVDEKVVEMIIEFHKAGKVIVTSCHSQLLLASAGLLKGKMCTAFPSLKPVVELAGGVWWEQEGVDSVLDITECVRDGNVISSIGWPVHDHYLNVLLDSIGARITGSGSISAIFLCGVSLQILFRSVSFCSVENNLGVRGIV